MARPTKQTPEIITKLEQAFSLDCTVSEACFQAGIAESTYYEWCNLDAELSERMKALKSKLILKARQTISDNLDDVSTAKWYLERKRKDEFNTVQVIEQTGEVEFKTNYMKEVQARLNIGSD